MPMNGVMKLPSLQRHFIFMTLSLVCILGGAAIYSLLRQPSKFDTRLATNTSSQRQPSSINPEELIPQDQVAPVAGKSISVNLPCEVQSLSPTQGAHLRLLGQACGKGHKKTTDISIQNLTNGFTAQVIELKEQSYTTDYIDLVEGENQLLIQRKDQAGVVHEQKIQILRQPASASSQAIDLSESNSK